MSIISNLKNIPWLSCFSSKTTEDSLAHALLDEKMISQIASKMKSREYIHLNIYCISRGYLTFPQKPQMIFKFCLR